MDYLSRISSIVTAPRSVTQNVAATGTKSLPRSAAASTPSPSITASAFSALMSGAKRSSAKHTARDPLSSFVADWTAVRTALHRPDQAALHYGIARTDIPLRMSRMLDALVFEETSETSGVGLCMEFVLREKVFPQLVRLALKEQPRGILLEVIKWFTSLIALLDGSFLARQSVHRPLVRLLRGCVGDEGKVETDSEGGGEEFLAGLVVSSADNDVGQATAGRFSRIGSVLAADYEPDLVDLMCHVAGRIRASPDLLFIFFRPSTSLSRPTSPASSVASTSTVQPRHAHFHEQSHLSDKDDMPFSPDDFPLFSYLLRFLHREGRTGELSRAGLVFILELAFESQSLEAVVTGVRTDLASYVATSDFAEVLGAGMGAVYGLLPTKLVITHQSSPSGSSLLGLEAMATAKLHESLTSASEDTPGQSEEYAEEAERSTSADLATQLQLLVNLLRFTQDTLGIMQRSSSEGRSLRSPSAVNVLREGITYAVQKLFLQNILYPSLLECTSLDGSAVAVLSYIDVLLCALDDEKELADIVIGWLMGVDIKSTESDLRRYALNTTNMEAASSVPDSTLNEADRKQNRRRSTAFLQLQEENSTLPQVIDSATYLSDKVDRFTIKDLIMDNIAAQAAPSASSAALRLLTSILLRHGRFANHGMIGIVLKSGATAFPLNDFHVGNGLTDVALHTMDEQSAGTSSPQASWMTNITALQHIVEIDILQSLIVSLDPQHSIADQGASNSSTAMDLYWDDAEALLLSESSYRRGVSALDMDANVSKTVRNDSSLITNPLRHHVLNSSDPFCRMLLGKTCDFFANAPAVNVALSGVLHALVICPYRSLIGWLVWPAAGLPSTSNKTDNERNQDRVLSLLLQSGAQPVLLQVLRSLVGQVLHFRSTIKAFDRYLRDRRKGLMFAENLNEALLVEDISSTTERETSAYAPSAGLISSSQEPHVNAFSRTWVKAGYEDFTGSQVFPFSINGTITVTGSQAPSNEGGVMSLDVPHEIQLRRKSSFARLFGGLAPDPNLRSSNIASLGEASEAPVPFSQHYEETASIAVSLLPVKVQFSEWTSEPPQSAAKERAGDTSERHSITKRTRFKEEKISDGDDDFVVTYPGAETAGSADGSSTECRSATLSSILDNVIILEEMIKELMAVIQVRRAGGIDAVTV